jgi:hypothetical protein
VGASSKNYRKRKEQHMAYEKGWFWMAAGVLALGLNGAYQDGEFQWVHAAAQRSVHAIEQASDQASRVIDVAEVMLGRTPASLERTEVALQRVQAKVACKRFEMAQREMAKAQVQRDLASARVDHQLAQMQMKMQMNMDRVRAITIERSSRINCPEMSRVVVMTSVPRIDLSNLPEVHIPQITIPSIAPHAHSNGPI